MQVARFVPECLNLRHVYIFTVFHFTLFLQSSPSTINHYLM